MHRSRFSVRRILGTVVVCLLLLPRLAAAADALLSADFDGDGQRDRVTMARRDAPALQVWLSATNTTQFLRTGAPIQRVVATDLDGDHRPELIASDTESRIHVFKAKHRKLKPYRLHAVPVPFTFRTQNRHHVDDSDGEAPDAVTGVRVSSLASLLSPLPSAPAPVVSVFFAPLTLPAGSTAATVDPFLPRPPPATRSR